jgi:signal recognition particle receptor subunit beta
MSLLKIPLVIQYNKRDLAEQGFDLMSIEQMDRDLNRQLKVPSFPASAFTGQGVGASLKECMKLTLKSLQKEMQIG